MEYYKDIETALKHERPTDILIKKLSNKFAIVKSLYTNGSYSEPSICALVDNSVKFYGPPKDVKKWFKRDGVNIKKITHSIIAYYRDPKTKTGTVYRRVTNDNRDYIKRHRKLYFLLSQ